MIKNLIIFVLFVAFALAINFPATTPECPKEPYEQNQMVDGCVMQKSGGTWIRTCG
jgi:hypothetical protein